MTILKYILIFDILILYLDYPSARNITLKEIGENDWFQITTKGEPFT